jgi:hypothetical protein
VNIKEKALKDIKESLQDMNLVDRLLKEGPGLNDSRKDTGSLCTISLDVEPLTIAGWDI